MNRIDKHGYPTERVATRLRRLGLSVSKVNAAVGYDLLVNDKLRVTLRVAFPSLRRHRVTVGGRAYRYRYRTWHFNFHRHGELTPRYTDVFICIAVQPERVRAISTFVIPWEAVSGKTFSLHDGRRAYDGRYSPWRDNWESIVDAVRAPLRNVA